MTQDVNFKPSEEAILRREIRGLKKDLQDKDKRIKELEGVVNEWRKYIGRITEYTSENRLGRAGRDSGITLIESHKSQIARIKKLEEIIIKGGLRSLYKDPRINPSWVISLDALTDKETSTLEELTKQ